MFEVKKLEQRCSSFFTVYQKMKEKVKRIVLGIDLEMRKETVQSRTSARMGKIVQIWNH